MLYFFLALLGMFQQLMVCAILFDHTFCFTTSIFLMNIEFHRLFPLFRVYKYGMNNALKAQRPRKSVRLTRCVASFIMWKQKFKI